MRRRAPLVPINSAGEENRAPALRLGEHVTWPTTDAQKPTPPTILCRLPFLFALFFLTRINFALRPGHSLLSQNYRADTPIHMFMRAGVRCVRNAPCEVKLQGTQQHTLVQAFNLGALAQTCLEQCEGAAALVSLSSRRCARITMSEVVLLLCPSA